VLLLRGVATPRCCFTGVATPRFDAQTLLLHNVVTAR